MWDKLSGRKAYLMAALLAALALLFRIDTLFNDNPATAIVETGWLSQATYEAIAMLLGGGGVAALRAGVKKAE